MVHGYYEARDPAATTELPPRPEGGADFGNYTQDNFNSSANRGVTLSRFFALYRYRYRTLSTVDSIHICSSSHEARQ